MPPNSTKKLSSQVAPSVWLRYVLLSTYSTSSYSLQSLCWVGCNSNTSKILQLIETGACFTITAVSIYYLRYSIIEEPRQDGQLRGRPHSCNRGSVLGHAGIANRSWLVGNSTTLMTASDLDNYRRRSCLHQTKALLPARSSFDQSWLSSASNFDPRL